jgi:transcriptional regulatory protein LevR
MITTATVIEAARKAILYENVNEIVKCARGESRYLGDFIEKQVRRNKKVIVTACSTGEGTALKLKEFASIKFGKDQYEIINLSIKDREEFNNAIENIRKNNIIEYIISAFDPQLEGIKYIPMDRFFKEYIGEDFEEKANDENMLNIIKDVYRDHLNIRNCDFIVKRFIEIISNMKCFYGIHVDEDKLMGLLMHFGCLLEKLINKEETRDCKNLSLILARYNDLFDDLKIGIEDIEKELEIKIPEGELANIIEILINI